MRHFLFAALLWLSFVSLAQAAACPASAVCPGKSCANIGTSQISDDRASLVVCLQTSGSNATLVWKSMTSSGSRVGSIIAWPATIDPADMVNWLECNGQAITQAAYPELYAVVGGRVPDLRGLFLRGLGGSSASLGTAQNYATYVPNASVTQTISGMQYGTAGSSDFCTDFYSDGGFSSARCIGGVGVWTPGGATTFSTTQTISTGATETRPANMAVRYLIRAKP